MFAILHFTVIKRGEINKKKKIYTYYVVIINEFRHPSLKYHGI